MDTHTDRLKNPAKRLPDVSLPDASGGETRIRRGRDAPVIILIHADCDECKRYIAEVAAESSELTDWSARPLAVVASTDGSPTGVPFPVLIDVDGRLAGAAGVEAPAVIIADQWGQVHERYEAGEAHDFPTPEQLVSDARYLAIRCPECEGESL